MEQHPAEGRGLPALVGQTVGGCLIESVLGEGGMGVVFRSRQLQLDRPVAIKFLAPRALNEDHLKRFDREIAVHKSLEHPGVVRIFDAGVFSGLPFIVMALMEGGSLRDWIRKPPLPSIAEIVEAGSQLFEAIAYLHQEGVLHRDLKPANVLRSPSNRLLVSDFALARLDQQTLMTTPGVLIGTLTHLAPEVLRGREPDPAVDRYAAGMILYEMVNGKLPFMFDNPTQWIWAIEHSPVPPPRREGIVCPPALETLILGLLGKDPTTRTSNEEALSVLRALQEELVPPDPTVRPSSSAARASPVKGGKKPFPGKEPGPIIP